MRPISASEWIPGGGITKETGPWILNPVKPLQEALERQNVLAVYDVHCYRSGSFSGWNR